MRWGVLVLGLLVLAAVLFLPSLWHDEPERVGDGHGYVDPQICAECHEEAFEQWRGSHHDLAMQEATDATVLGDFDDVAFERYGITSRLFKRDGRFFVHTEGEDGKLADFEVKYTFGVAPLQQYLVELDRGRMHALTICWDTEKKRWFHLHDEKIVPDDPLHWTGPAFNWNYMCAECHSTNLQKNYDPETATYDTTWSVIDVSCQACHGPGTEHVAWAREVAETDAEYPADDLKGLPVRLQGLDAALTEIETCARCHSRRSLVDGDYRHGDRLLDHYEPALLTERLYHADGQILDEVYVYGSFLQAKKFHAGVRCTDCHDPHTARMRLEGNTMCQRCHQTEPPQQFPTLQKKEYDTPDHHFHEPGTPGSQCVDCHMRATTYMQVDPRRDHSFKIPRPDLTALVGVPNACNGCHKDKSAKWAAAEIEQRLPRATPRSLHYGVAIAAGRAGQPEARAALSAFSLDPETPAIVRATTVALLRRYGDAPTAARATRDPEAIVRLAAIRHLAAANLPPRRRAELIAPLLEDPARVVRTAAARALTDLPEGLLPDAGAFRRALDEFKRRQDAVAERPEAYLNLGAMHASQGNLRDAETMYLKAIELDPRFLPPRFNLANLYNAQGRNADAEVQLREVVRRAPDQGEAHYSLGLLLAEEKRLADAADALARAAALLPGQPRVHYNLGLAQRDLGRGAEAEAALLAAEKLAPRDPDIVNALALLYAQRREFKLALPYARRLAALLPGAPGPQQLVGRIEAELRR